MFFGRQPDPVDKSKVIEALARWHRDTEAIDNATDAMRLIAAQDPEGVQSDSFEQKRLATVQVVDRVLENTKVDSNWPELKDYKGVALMSTLQMLTNVSLASQLDSLRLQREHIETLKGNRPPSNNASELALVHHQMAVQIDEMGKVATKLGKHYKVTPQEYIRATRS